MSEETGSDESGEKRERSLKPFYIGGAIVAAAGLGFVAANLGNDDDWSDPANAEVAKQEDQASNAIVQEPEPEPEPDVRGVIKPKKESTIASKITARITSMPFDKGRSFRRGALLARFDCSTTRAELKAAQAATQAYKASYDTNVELDEYEAIGKNEVAVSRANLGKARAEAKAINAQLSDCAVYAPFSGTVVDQIARRGEIAASGQPLLKIQSGGDLEVELIVPSNWLTWLRPGAPFNFKIDETGNNIGGQITRLGASVDPVSKTIRVTGSVDQSEGLVLPGMSGTAMITQPADEPAKTKEASTEATGSAKKNSSEKPVVKKADGNKTS